MYSCRPPRQADSAPAIRSCAGDIVSLPGGAGPRTCRRHTECARRFPGQPRSRLPVAVTTPCGSPGFPFAMRFSSPALPSNSHGARARSPALCQRAAAKRSRLSKRTRTRRPAGRRQPLEPASCPFCGSLRKPTDRASTGSPASQPSRSFANSSAPGIAAIRLLLQAFQAHCFQVARHVRVQHAGTGRLTPKGDPGQG